MTDDAKLRGQETGDGEQAADTELLRRYAEEKSDKAFGELVRRHIDFVYAAALRQARGNAPLAEDVTQTVFTDLARKASQLARHEVVVGWLHTATRFAVAKAIRSESRRQAREQEAFAMNEALHESGAPIDWERLHPVLDEVLGELKEHERAAILLRFFEKMTLAEVGAKLSLTESAARSCVDRALEKMHTLLACRGVTSTAAALGVALANQVGVAAPAGLAASVTGAALGASSACVSVATTLLHFMSTTKTMIGVVSVLAVFLMGTASYEAEKARTISVSLAAAMQARSELGERLRRSEEQAAQAKLELRDAQRQIATLRKEIERGRASKSAASAAQSGGKEGATSSEMAAFVSVQDQMVKDPEYLQIRGNLDRTNARLRFGALYQKLHLSPQQIEAFENRWVAYLQTANDVAAAVSMQGVSLSDPGFGALVQKSLQENARAMGADMESILGPDGAKELGTYNATASARDLVNTVAGNLFYSDTPLTADQGDQLARTLASNSVYAPAGATDKRPDVNWSTALPQLEGVLSSSQLETVRRVSEQRLLQRQLDQLSAKLRREQSAKVGGAPAR